VAWSAFHLKNAAALGFQQGTLDTFFFVYQGYFIYRSTSKHQKLNNGRKEGKLGIAQMHGKQQNQPWKRKLKGQVLLPK
jgi:hypothetical protein